MNVPSLNASYVCLYRLAGGDTALSDLVRRREELSTWLEQAENAVRSFPVVSTDKNLKELKVQRGSKRGKWGFISVPKLSRFGHLYGQQPSVGKTQHHSFSLRRFFFYLTYHI